MSELRDDDAALDRILAKGALGGPQVDRMWEGLEKRLEPETRPSVVARLLKWSPLALVPLGAAAALLLMPNDDMRARGDGEHTVLQASCGVSSPCTVGQPLFLRISSDAAGSAFVFLVDAAGRKAMVAGPLAMKGDNVLVDVGAKITPEASDVAAGIRFVAVVDSDLTRARAGEGTRAELIVQVAP